MIEIILIESTWPPRRGEYRSKIVLNYDNWNDYGYRTSFGMYYCDENKEVYTSLVKQYGNNYWETCIYEGVLNSPDFLSLYFSRI